MNWRGEMKVKGIAKEETNREERGEKRAELEEGTPNEPTTSDCRKPLESKSITGEALAMPTA